MSSVAPDVHEEMRRHREVIACVLAQLGTGNASGGGGCGGGKGLVSPRCYTYHLSLATGVTLDTMDEEKGQEHPVVAPAAELMPSAAHVARVLGELVRDPDGEILGSMLEHDARTSEQQSKAREWLPNGLTWFDFILTPHGVHSAPLHVAALLRGAVLCHRAVAGLTALRFAYTGPAWDDRAAIENVARWLCRAKVLTTLEVVGFPRGKLAGAFDMLPESLQELALVRCGDVTPLSVQIIARKCVRLSRLCLVGLDELRDQAGVFLSELRLVTLYVSDCPNVTGLFFAGAVSRREIGELTIRRCAFVGDELFSVFVPGTKLACLRLDDLPRVTGSNMALIRLAYVMYLERVTLRNLAGFKPIMLLGLLGALQWLRELEVSNVAGATDAEIRFIKAAIDQLEIDLCDGEERARIVVKCAPDASAQLP